MFCAPPQKKFRCILDNVPLRGHFGHRHHHRNSEVRRSQRLTSEVETGIAPEIVYACAGNFDNS
eukprot:6474400-Amphidinium_carterae.1